jgi:hypothetical protein
MALSGSRSCEMACCFSDQSPSSPASSVYRVSAIFPPEIETTSSEKNVYLALCIMAFWTTVVFFLRQTILPYNFKFF